MPKTFDVYDPAHLPAAVVAYLDARDARRYADAAALFVPDAIVRDDGNTYDGVDAITEWIESSSSEYSYTSTRIGVQSAGEDRVVVQVRLDGNFPGGSVVLRYQFDLRAELISRLAIEV